jgi:hypothetical protein
MRVTRATALILAALALTTVSTATGFMFSHGGYFAPIASPSLLGATGGINGTISIGPVYPVCRVLESPTLATYYSQVQVVISPSSGLTLDVPVNWILYSGCWAQGTFKIALNPGAYSLTLTSCSQVHLLISQPLGFGCSDLPRNVIVESGGWTQFALAVDTGIR